MDFSDTTNRDGIIQQIEIESGLGLAAISGNAAPDYWLNYFTAKINEWLHIVTHWIHQVNDEVIYDDVNNTGTIPEEFSFTDNTQIYDLDSDITKIRKAEAHDIAAASKIFTVTIASPAVFTRANHGLVSGDTVYFTTTGALPTGLSASTTYYVIAAGLTTDTFRVSATLGGAAINTSGTQSGTHTMVINKIGWYDLDFYYETDRVEDLYGQDPASPIKYFTQGRKLIFDVPVDTAESDKYRLTYDRHAHEFETTDTTATPGFDKQFHPILVYGPVMDWANGKFPDIFSKCRLKLYGQGEGDKEALKTMLKEHYARQVVTPYKIGRKYKSMI